MIGLPAQSLFEDDGRRLVLGHLRPDAGGKGGPCEVRVATSSGGHRTLRLQTIGLGYDNPAHGVLLVTAIDVSDMHLAQQVARHSERILESTFRAFQDLVLVVDRKLEIVATNADDKRQDFLLAEHAGKTCHECIFGRERPCEDCPVQRTFLEGVPTARQLTHPATGRTYDVRAYPIVGDDGQISLVAEHVRDVTEQEAAKEALKKSEALFRAITEHSADLTMILDSEGRFAYASPAVHSILGYEPEECIGKKPYDFGHPEDWPIIEPALAAAAAATQQDPMPILVRVQHKNGQWIHLEILLVSMHDVPGAEGVVANCRDISDRKRAEDELQAYASAMENANRALEQYNRRAQAATRAKSEFLANMSHEIRTPLTAIMGFAEMLLSEGDITKAPPHRVEAVQTIIRNSNYLIRLINDILDLSKIEAGKMEIERIPCRTTSLVDDVIQLTQIRAQEKGLPLSAEYHGPVPEEIQTDPTRLRQVLVNLIANAIKFTESGEVKVVVSYRPKEDEESVDQLQFDVIDTGIGMSAEQMGRLFQPFTQADGSTTRRFGGTGLGLSISKRLAEKLGGWIDVESEPGRGSRFRVCVDPGPVDQTRLREPSRNDSSSAQEPTEPQSAQRPQLEGRILLAEDAPDTQRLVSVILRKAGADVTCVGDGEQAFQKALEAWRAGRPFDLVLMDMQMPVLDGYDATTKLRQHGYTGPVVALTAHAMAGERDKCLAAGCDGYATKPIDRASLLETAHAYLAVESPVDP
jgi:PAS domain S-box-containing protein